MLKEKEACEMQDEYDAMAKEKPLFSKPDYLTEFTIAEHLAKTHSDHMRYIKSHGWVSWTGTHYAADEEAHAYFIIKSYLAWLLRDAKRIEDDKTRASAIKMLQAFETHKKFLNTLACCANEFADSYTVFDTDPFAFNCGNGTIDLRSGVLRPHSKADRITRVSPVVFDAAATCPRWLQFLDEVTCNRADLKRFLQQAVGCSLSAVPVKKLFFLHGDGDNGKTTFLNPICRLLGTYHSNIQIESLCVKRGESIPNDIARLAGTRFVTTSETQQGRQINESLIKLVTGGSVVTARFLRKEFFDFPAFFKLWMDGNHKPRIKGTDSAIWERITLVPFDACFAKCKDITLPETLRGEMSGILNWALAGFRDWQANGFVEPECCKLAVEEYREEQDDFGQFIKERVKVVEGDKVTIDQMFSAYSSWAIFSKIEYPLNKFVFGRKFKEAGFKQNGKRDKWVNVSVKDDWQRFVE